jgi:peptide/nickel transport system permease protein
MQLSMRDTESPWHRALRHLRHDWPALAGLIVIIILVLLAVLAPVITRHSPYKANFKLIRAAPSREHLLGNDGIGRDVFSRLIYGTRVSLSVGLVAAGIQVVVGALVGLAAGFYGGWIDTIAMRVVDMFRALPTLLLIILLVSIVGPSIYNLMAVLGLLGWPALSRIVRAEVLSLRERGFTEAARAMGAGAWHIMFKHLLPNLMGPLTVAGTFGLANAILSEAALSFLGLGIQPPQSSWGSMMNEAISLHILVSMPYLWVPPGLMIFVSVLSINFIGDGLRDAFDPQLWR